MKSEMCLHTYKRPRIRIIMCSSDRVMYSECGFGTAVPISYRVIPGKSFSVHVLTCLPRGKHQPPSFGSSSLVRCHNSPASLVVVSRKSYTQLIF